MRLNNSKMNKKSNNMKLKYNSIYQSKNKGKKCTKNKSNKFQ